MMSRKAERADQISGFIIALLMLVAFGLVARNVYSVATGPPPPRPGIVSPQLEGILVRGGPFKLKDYRGRVVILDFWATWCPPCVASMPNLQKLYEKYRAQGVVFLGVNQEPEQLQRVRGFLIRNKISFPNLIDPGEVSKQFGVMTLPTSMVVDQKGIIRAVHRGAVSKARLEQDITRLLGQNEGTSK